MSTLTHIRDHMLVPAGIWTVDCARSTVRFEVRHLKLTKTSGRFRGFGGVIRCEGEDGVSILGSIDVASIDTGDPRRDARLRGGEFFDAERHPAIYVNLASPAAPAADALSVGGTMTIRGVERPIELGVEGPAARLNWDGDRRIRAWGAISRRDFGLTWDPVFAAGGLVIDDRVELRLDVVIVRV